jgi:hypothetical protein
LKKSKTKQTEKIAKEEAKYDWFESDDFTSFAVSPRILSKVKNGRSIAGKFGFSRAFDF